jgi:predicted DNA-binding WGR domain protein
VQENATAMRKFWISKLNWKSLKTKHNLGNKFASPEAGPQEKILYKINEKKKKGNSELETHHRKDREANFRVDSGTELLGKRVLSGD